MSPHSGIREEPPPHKVFDLCDRLQSRPMIEDVPPASGPAAIGLGLRRTWLTGRALLMVLGKQERQRGDLPVDHLAYYNLEHAMRHCRRNFSL